MFKAIEYKLILLGPEILIGSAIAALIGFLLLSVFFFNYPKLFLEWKEPARPMTSQPADVATASSSKTARRLRRVRNRKHDQKSPHAWQSPFADEIT